MVCVCVCVPSQKKTSFDGIFSRKKNTTKDVVTIQVNMPSAYADEVSWGNLGTFFSNMFLPEANLGVVCVWKDFS